MKKFFLFLCVLPFLCFASFEYDGYTVKLWYLYNYNSYDSTSLRNQTYALQPNSIEDVRAFYFNHTYSFKLKDRTTTSHYWTFLTPNRDVLQTSAYSISISNGVGCVSNSVNFLLSPLHFREIEPFYVGAASLFVSGYRGPGLEVFDSSSTHCINVNLVDLIPNILSSTNSVYRQILLSSLSSISDSLSGVSSSLSSIDLHLSTLSGISSNVFSVSSDVSDLLYESRISSNVLSSIDASVSRLAPLSADDLLSILLTVQDEGPSPYFNFSNFIHELDRSNWDPSPSVDSVFDFWSDAICRGVPLVASFVKGFEAYQPYGPSGLSGFPALGRQFNSSLSSDIGNGVNLLSNSLSSVSSRVDDVGSSLSNSLGRVNSSLDSGFSSLVSLSSLGPDSSLAALFSGDPSRLGELHTDPDDPLNPNNPNSILNPNNPSFAGRGGGIYGAFTTNNVVRPLTNAVSHAEASISSNIFQGAKNVSSNVVDSASKLKDILDKINELLENLTTPDSGDSIAASVRIVSPLDDGRVAVDLPWGPGDLIDVNVLSNIIVDAVSSFNPHFSITNTAPDYTPYLEQLISNTAPYRLWTDYESLMNNDWSAVCDAALDDSFKDSISDFDLIGNDFWHYFTYVSGRQACDVHSIANIFTNVLPLVDFINSQDFGSDDSGNGKSIFAVGSEVISSYPTRTAIVDYISQVTNSSSAVLSSTNGLYQLSSITNTVNDILGRYFLDKGSSLPSSLVFFKLSSPNGGDSKYFEIPISDRQELWSILRASITVVFTLVNLILLPKFLLMVFRLFMRLFNRSLPFLASKE